jgi:hypothetical protein
MGEWHTGAYYFSVKNVFLIWRAVIKFAKSKYFDFLSGLSV